MYSMKHPATPHKRGVSITFADLDYDDRIKTISRRKQGQVSVILGKYVRIFLCVLFFFLLLTILVRTAIKGESWEGGIWNCT